MYCKAPNICGFKNFRVDKNDISGQINLGIHYIPWLQMIKKVWCKFEKKNPYFSVKIFIVAYISIASSRQF